MWINFNELFHTVFTKVDEVLAAHKKVESQIMLLNCESRVDLQYPENNV